MPKRILTYGVMLFAATALLACSATPGSSLLPDTSNSLSGRLVGNVIYRERIALDPQAVIEVQLLDVSRADAPAEVIASQAINAGGKQVPIQFELSYDPAQIDSRNRYTVSASILVNGELGWISQESNPVLTQGGAVDEVEILVKRVPGSVSELPDQEFTLQSLIVDGVEVELEQSVSTTIRFAADGTFSGSGGCNRYTGSYTRDGSKISLGNAAATMMACPAGEAQEMQFFKALPIISSFELTKDGLQLSSNDGKTMMKFVGDI